MNTLINKQPSRFFAFGCSFTHYNWATWANILAYELECEFYNFGKSGAGNTFIANTVTQANKYFNFDKNDLVIVSWTNISREDRWVPKRGWLTPGNIYSQQDYDKKFVKQWANDTHFALRDFSYIDLIDSYLKNITNYHFLSMCDITRHIDQWGNGSNNQNTEVDNISELYRESLSKINTSFYDVLWNSDMQYKWKKDWQEIHPHFSDGHPTPLEHYDYLKQTFNYKFSEDTDNAIARLQRDWIRYIRKGYSKTKRSCGLHDMPNKWTDEIYNNFRLKPEKPMPHQLWH